MVGVLGLVLLHFGLGTSFRDEIIMRKKVVAAQDKKKESAIVQFSHELCQLTIFSDTFLQNLLQFEF